MILIMGWEREEKGNRIGVEKEKRWRGKGCKSIVSFIVVGTKNKWIFEARKLRLEVWGGERSKRKGKREERKEAEGREEKRRGEKGKESENHSRKKTREELLNILFFSISSIYTQTLEHFILYSFNLLFFLPLLHHHHLTHFTLYFSPDSCSCKKMKGSKGVWEERLFPSPNRFEGARHSSDAVTSPSWFFNSVAAKKSGRKEERQIWGKRRTHKRIGMESSRKEFYRFRKEWKGRETETRWESSVFSLSVSSLIQLQVYSCTIPCPGRAI